MYKNSIICREPGRYLGWPSVARTADGEILVVFSGDRDAHVCPFGKTQMIRSRDNGQTWTSPETINNTPLDDRDAGIIILKSETILISWFTSLAFEQYSMPDDIIQRWKPYTDKITVRDRKQWADLEVGRGYWTRRSRDGGKIWDSPTKAHASAPHGPIQLKNGKVIYIGTGKKDFGHLLVEESSDEGRTWNCLVADLTSKETECHKFCEPHIVETSSGRLVAMFRAEKDMPERYIWQSESDDEGRTWSTPHVTPIWGFPPHLIRLKDGRLLVTYGYRRNPYGERACLSYDEGKTWDIRHEIILRDDAPDGDLGYPASVEMDNGDILTVYYQGGSVGRKDGSHGNNLETELGDNRTLHWRIKSFNDNGDVMWRSLKNYCIAVL